MDGAFVKKIIKITICLFLIISALGILDLQKDKHTLQDRLVRLHVVGNSDSATDQKIKLQVKDTIVAYLRPVMEKCATKEEAMQHIRDNLTQLQEISNQTLDRLGVKDRAKITLQAEEFGKREYDTFSLPSGIYDALRIEIGEAKGKNWWCVAFPTLCVPAAGNGFADTAVSAGFSDTLSDTLTGTNGYQIRFFLLDCIGKLENLFHKG